MDCTKRTPSGWPWPCVDGEPAVPGDTLWDVDGTWVEVGSVRFDREGVSVEVRRPVPDAPDGYYVTLVDADDAAFTRLSRTETDSWGKLKGDAALETTEYWGCEGSPCDSCPVLVGGRTPMGRYGTDGCGDAVRHDIVRRAKALAGVVE